MGRRGDEAERRVNGSPRVSCCQSAVVGRRVPRLLPVQLQAARERTEVLEFRKRAHRGGGGGGAGGRQRVGLRGAGGRRAGGEPTLGRVAAEGGRHGPASPLPAPQRAVDSRPPPARPPPPGRARGKAACTAAAAHGWLATRPAAGGQGGGAGGGWWRAWPPPPRTPPPRPGHQPTCRRPRRPRGCRRSPPHCTAGHGLRVLAAPALPAHQLPQASPQGTLVGVRGPRPLSAYRPGRGEAPACGRRPRQRQARRPSARRPPRAGAALASPSRPPRTSPPLPPSLLASPPPTHVPLPSSMLPRVPCLPPPPQ